MNSTELIISSKSKVLQAIEAYPQLEDVIINYAPAFKQLKNPVLSRTAAKIATLQQAASVGNVNAGEFINHLRKIVGQNLMDDTEKSDFVTRKPEWFDEELIYSELDICEMLASGEQPVNQLMEDLKNLAEGKIFKVIAPLIDKTSSISIKHCIDKKTMIFSIFILKSKCNTKA